MTTSTDSGRAVCAWCGADLGARAGLEHGATTHGICPRCKARMDLELVLQEPRGRFAKRGRTTDGWVLRWVAYTSRGGRLVASGVELPGKWSHLPTLRERMRLVRILERMGARRVVWFRRPGWGPDHRGDEPYSRWWKAARVRQDLVLL